MSFRLYPRPPDPKFGGGSTVQKPRAFRETHSPESRWQEPRRSLSLRNGDPVGRLCRPLAPSSLRARGLQ
eukprot:5648707-Alexandrium_andersonii.AAC.1